MDHLCLMLEGIPNERNEKIQKETMKFCVRYHQDIISISNKTAKLYNKILGVHTIFTAVVFALLAKQSANIDGVVQMVGWLITIFVMCHSGQELIYMSETLGEKIICMCNWYKMNKSLQKDLQLIILRSQKPLTIPAGPFAYLTYDLFIAIIKMAYSYFALISRSTNDS
ncbi:putative odorant receptor 92a [Aethina tumida]|uniref:putative odorant receptor 92a n=1 Tax=Aethina tumida TaxID=116153 RepID=UPI002147691F|nr:putative odorant receptor 92a [Aethina tumida]